MSIAAVIVISIVLIVTNILYIHAILACRIETTGIYVKYNTVHDSRRTITYEPVFRYDIKGEEFQGRCLSKMKLPDIQNQFVAGQTYTIYVNNKKPGYFIVYRKVPVLNVISILIGIILLAGGLFYYFG